MVLLAQFAEVPVLFSNWENHFLIQFGMGMKVYKFEVYVIVIGKFKRNKSEKCTVHFYAFFVFNKSGISWITSNGMV